MPVHYLKSFIKSSSSVENITNVYYITFEQQTIRFYAENSGMLPVCEWVVGKYGRDCEKVGAYYENKIMVDYISIYFA